MRNGILTLGAALVAGATLYLLQSGQEGGAPAAPEPETPTGLQSEAPADPKPLVRPLAFEQKAEPAPEAPAVFYPDGTRIVPLNGITESVQLIWPASIEMTPIVGTIRDQAPPYWEWYVHENGAQSTVARFRLKDGGPETANGIVRAPFAYSKALR